MTSTLIILLVLNVLCEGKIKMDITVGSNFKDAKIEFSGVDDKLLTEKEIKMYNFTKEKLNKGVRIELGRVPDDIFWQDPTPYYNLFEKFKWPPVLRHLKINKASVVHIATEKKILKVGDHTNNTTKIVTSKISTSELLENTISSTWSKEGIPDDDIYFDVLIHFNKIKFQYQEKWRSEILKSAILPFGIPNEEFKTVMIKPGKTVTSKLTGFKTVILIEIEYVAKLIGTIILDYEDLYGKYHFYAPNVGDIMRAAKMNNEIKTTQFLELRCYTEPKLDVFDSTSGEYVQFTELDHFHPVVKGRIHL